MQWQRTFTSDQGLVLTPLVAARGDVFGLSMDSPTQLGAALNTYDGGFEDGNLAGRGSANRRP